MAFNKAKALQEAHKFVTQGRTAQAIRQYERIVEMDPGDLTLLNVIGDLYARDNNSRKALECFYRLADAFAREGYKLKAIAIYKKISKMDQTTAEPLLKLAELNAGQGVAREAREQYKNAFEFFERTKQKDKALEVLRDLCQLDPKSTSMRLKLAQFAEGAGESKEAADAYLETFELAHQSGEAPAAENALKKAAELAPENPKVHLYRARQALADQKPAEAKAILDSVPNLPDTPEAQRLLLESYLADRNLDAARDVLLDVFQSNPSDFSPVAEFVAGCIAKQQYDTAFEALTVIAPHLVQRRETRLLMETLRTLWKATPEPINTLEFMYQVAEKTADEGTIPEILEALGSSYIQTQQLEKAEQAYARLVGREPENETYKDLLRQVLERQGKEYLPLGQTPFISAGVGLEAGTEDSATTGYTVGPGQPTIVKAAVANSELLVRDGLIAAAVKELEKVFHAYPDQVEIHARILEICKANLPGRAVQAAGALAQAYLAQGDSSAAKRYHEEALMLAQTAASAEAVSLPVRQDMAPARPVAGEAEQHAASVEIDLSRSVDRKGIAENEAQASYEVERTDEESGTCQGNAPGEEPSTGQAHRALTQDAASAFNYDESREEIEFYVRHGFYGEARKAVLELEKNYPGEARVSELRQQIAELSQEPDGPEGLRTGTQEKETPALELPTSFSEISEKGGPVDDSGLPCESGSVAHRDNDVQQSSGGPASTMESIPDSSDVPSAPSTSHGQDSAPRTGEDASLGLASLLDELNEANESIEQTADDEETHYNLGVAFREMDLLDEAIGEFQKAVKGEEPRRFRRNFLQACTLLAICFMDKGMPTIAAKWYSRALESPGLDQEGQLALYYDLGIAFEKAGNTTAALEKFTEVYSRT